MDQIFDRFGTLLKSLLNQDKDPFGGNSTGSYRSGAAGDPDLDDAMEELDAFLKDDREGQERLERERELRREREERARRKSTSFGQSGGASTPSPRLVEDFKTLGVPFGTPLAQVKSAYKRLLKEHHPDRHGGSAEEQKRATERSARINEAYARIEAWSTTGKYPEA